MPSKSSMTIKKVKLPPVHPGEVLAGELEEMGVSVTALRLAAYFGASPRLWLNLQASYDLAVAEAANGAIIQSRVRPFAA